MIEMNIILSKIIMYNSAINYQAIKGTNGFTLFCHDTVSTDWSKVMCSAELRRAKFISCLRRVYTGLSTGRRKDAMRESAPCIFQF